MHFHPGFPEPFKIDDMQRVRAKKIGNALDRALRIFLGEDRTDRDFKRFALTR